MGCGSAGSILCKVSTSIPAILALSLYKCEGVVVVVVDKQVGKRWTIPVLFLSNVLLYCGLSTSLSHNDKG